MSFFGLFDQQGPQGQDIVLPVAPSGLFLGGAAGFLARGPHLEHGEVRGHRAFAALPPRDLLEHGGLSNKVGQWAGRLAVSGQGRWAQPVTGAGRRLVAVGLFTPQEAAAYLTAVLAAHHRQEPADQINGLAAELGHLPLALAQAAAYIIDTGLTCTSYWEMLADRIRELADLLPESGALPDDQTTTAAPVPPRSLPQDLACGKAEGGHAESDHECKRQSHLGR
ncbi:hypothetical protein ACFZA1_39715 [Streptomyces filipinensis]|uniref:hypothetical protein n=1 Tax=Streptomyces filipinensis TaxID=66887 RepID=UPI0036E91690